MKRSELPGETRVQLWSTDGGVPSNSEVPPESHSAPHTDLEIEVQDDLASLAAEWDRLADRVGADLFARPGWIERWWSAFGVGRLEFLTARRDGNLVALLPIERRGRLLRSPTNGHTPRFHLLAADMDARRSLAEAVFQRSGDRVSLSFLDPAGVDTFRAAALAHRNRLLVETIEDSPYLVIDGSWDEYEKRLDGKVVRDIRRRRRRLEEEGRVEFDLADGSERLAELLEEGFAIEGSGWKDDRGTAIASSPDTRRFYTDVAQWAAARDSLRLGFLRLDGRAIAFHYGVEERGVYYLLKGGFDRNYDRFAPGRLLLRFMLEHSFSAGLRRYEFLGHDESWKLEWTDSCRRQQRLQAFAPATRSLVDWLALAYVRPAAAGGRARIRRLLRR